MRILLFLLASLAYGQSEFGASAIRLLPRSADTDTGILRFYEYSSGGSRIDLKGQVSLTADKILRLPGEDGVLIADENHRYGTDSFTITGNKARGTEASPSDVSSGDVLFQFLGNARSGGAFVNAGSITFSVDAASPLDTSVNFGLTVGGSYGTRFAMDKEKFYGVGRPKLGLSSAGGRWGTLYGDSADFLVPTGSSPAYETGSFVRTQTLDIYDIGGQSGGWSLTAENETVGDSFLRITDASATDALRIYRKIANATTNHVRSYMDIFPNQADTYNLGSDALPWDNLWAHDANVVNLSLEGNSTYRTYFTGGSSLSANLTLTWPSAHGTGPLCNDGAGALSWATCGTSTGGYPLGEANVADFFAVHGGDNTCTADCTAAFQAAVDSLGTRGGKVTAPPGCYKVSGTIQIGDGQPSSTCSRGIGDPWYTCLSTVNSVTIEGAGTVVNAGTHPGGTFTDAATEIHWDSGVAPGSATPIFKFQGPISGGGLKSMYVNLNNTANVYGVEQIQHNRGTFEDLTFVTGRRLVWNVTTNNNNNNAFLGSCGNRYVNIIVDKPGSGQSGISLDGGVPALDSCSNVFIGGSFVRDANTSGTYSLKLRYADNNTFLRTNFLSYPLGASTSDPDVLFEQYSGSTDFPKENHFIGNSTHFGFGGTSGTGWNTIDNYQWQDCAVTLNCIEFSMPYLRGTVDGKSFASATDPPGPKFPHGTASTDYTFKLWQSNGGNNSVGALAFQRYTDPIQFRISGNTANGLSIWTAPHLGTLTERWQFRGDGHLLPVTTNAMDVGGLSNKLRNVYATTLNSQDLFSSTINTYTPLSISSGVQSNYLRGDVSTNIYCEAYAATGSTSERCAFHFYRLGGSYGAESAVGNSWRLGGIFAWGHPSTTPSVGIEFYAASSGVTGTGVVPGEMRLSTQDSSGTRATRWILKANGALEPNLNATYDIGSSSFTAGHIYTQNITINGTCFGSGCSSGGGGSYVTTNTAQTITGLKTLSGTRLEWNTANQENLRFYDNGSGGHYGIGIGTFGAMMRFVKPSGTASFSFGSGSYSSYTEEVFFNQNYFDIGGRWLTGSGIVMVGEDLVPAYGNTLDLGSSFAPTRWKKLWVNDIDFNGSITAPSGAFGISGTFTCASGEAVKSFTVSGGIMTSYTCGTP